MDAGVFGDADPGPLLRALAAAGVRLAQLRGKGMRAGALCSWVAAGLRGAAGTPLRVVVNDRAEVALLTGAAGVHLGQDDLSPRRARAFLGDHAVIGLSTHTRAQAVAAAGEPVDYLAVGPVFETATKDDSAPVVGVPGVRRARECYDGPLAAIGGISGPRVREALAAGADAVAVIGALRGGSPEEVGDRAAALLAAAGGRENISRRE